MGLYEELLDVLAKEAKEAPGWFFLIIACNFLPLSLLLPWIHEIVTTMGIEIEKEHNTFATLVAVTLFFIGDCLDTLVFPREKDGTRAKKILYSVMLTLASWGLFLLVLKKWWAAFFWVPWLALYVIQLMPRQEIRGIRLTSDRPGESPKTKLDLKPSKKRRSGFNCLVWPKSLRKRLVQAQRDAKKKLYPVSKSLARWGRIYNPWTMIQNESAKFFRSAVIPLALWAVWLFFQGQWGWVLVTVLAASAILLLYCSLKTRHMCRLYEEAPKLTYTTENVAEDEDVRVFLWNTGSIDKPEYTVVASEKARVR